MTDMAKKQRNIRHLLTAAGEALQAEPRTIPWNTYPRPQMKRDRWLNLNGSWDFCAVPETVQGYIDRESLCEEKILVPFPPESLLSGICRDMGSHPRLFYRRTFRVPEGFARKGEKLLLHLGATDQYAEVFLNGYLQPSDVCGSRSLGAYRTLTYDVTNSIDLYGENTLEITAEDWLEDERIPYGKQSLSPGGMWYTPISGIWQTVWLEVVPENYIRALRVATNGHTVTVSLTMSDEEDMPEGQVTVAFPAGDAVYPLEKGTAIFTVDSPRLWSPEDPYLYEFSVEAGEDKVRSYFALRTLEIKKVDGIPRLCLNGKPYFLHALLDQGYWSDGIYTPASPECYAQDILAMKSLGFNTLRKHIKVEPEQFYYDCDRLGMLVMQDMVNNGHYSFVHDTALPTVGIKGLSDKRLHRDEATRKAFYEGMESTVEQLYNHPCIVYWTIFNEGWGQFDGNTTYHRLRELDATRFIDTASGWFKVTDTDVDSEHVYFKPVKLKYSEKPMVLSEFGGYAWKIAEHAANPDKTYGYRMFDDGQAFEDALVRLYETEIIPAVKLGLCGAVYTQVSDVEDETNGLLSYDRKMRKVSAVRMRRIADALTAAIATKKED